MPSTTLRMLPPEKGMNTKVIARQICPCSRKNRFRPTQAVMVRSINSSMAKTRICPATRMLVRFGIPKRPYLRSNLFSQLFMHHASRS